MTQSKSASSSSRFDDPRADALDLSAESLFSVRGKVAIVTGGSRGIGLMMAKGLARNGAKVYVCSRKAEACDVAVRELEAAYGVGCAVALPADLSTIENVEAFVAAFRQRETALHILINNAGATFGGSFETYPDAAWEKVLNLNVRHVFNLTRLLLPELEAGATTDDPARVVNIASTDGLRAQQTEGPIAAYAYTTSKGAVVHLTKALCRTLSKHSVTVNCIAPGVFPSQMTKFFLGDDASREATEQRNPMGRNGRTADIAATVLYLTGPGGAFTNGAIIPLDGGAYLHDASMY